MKTVFLLSCTARKHEYSCTAEEMYKPSDFYAASLEYALNRVENKHEQIFILSANPKHRLLSLSDFIATYNITLSENPQERDEWGRYIFDRLSEKHDVKNTKFVFLTTNNYAYPVIKYLSRFNYEMPLKPINHDDRVAWMEQNAVSVKNDSNIIEKPSVLTSTLACKLRLCENLQNIPNDKPGWYRWWAPITALEHLLNSQFIKKAYLAELLPYLRQHEKYKNYYCVYVGTAIGMSIRGRLDWHVNQPKHITKLSTLRNTVSCLVAGNQYDENTTNGLIDLLTIEYCALNYPINNTETRYILENIEMRELSDFVMPLNIKDNNHAIIQPFLLELRMARQRANN